MGLLCVGLALVTTLRKLDFVCCLDGEFSKEAGDSLQKIIRGSKRLCLCTHVHCGLLISAKAVSPFLAHFRWGIRRRRSSCEVRIKAAQQQDLARLSIAPSLFRPHPAAHGQILQQDPRGGWYGRSDTLPPLVCVFIAQVCS